MKRGENIYKRKDGRWEGRYIKARKIDGSIYYGYIYARTYQEVKQRLTEKKAEKNYSARRHVYQGTVREWANYWLTSIMKQKIKQSTYASYQSKLNVHILPALGEKTLRNVTKGDIEQWVRKLQGTLASSSIQLVFRVLNSCFEYGKEQGVLESNPCEGVRLPKKRKTTVQALSRSQHRRVERESLKSSKGLPVLLALETGMRIGEICALRFEDIDFSTSVLTVKRTRQRVATPYTDQKTTLIETSPKTESSKRMIPLTAKIKKVLLQAKRESRCDYVIASGNHAVEPRTISYQFAKLKEKLHLENISFHSLRHTFATRCVEIGANIASVSSLMGHASIKMTLDTYTSSFFSDQKKVIHQLEKRAKNG